jgi:hypothetical protein
MAAAQRTQKAEAERWVAASGVHRGYEAALRTAAREMRQGPACCCNRHRWPAEMAPSPARERARREYAEWRAAVGLDWPADDLVDKETEQGEEHSL